MRSRYKITKNNYPYFITCTIIEWIPVFTDKKYADIVTESLGFYRNKNFLKLIAYVIMDNHIHIVINCENTVNFIKQFKSYTAREMVKMAQREKKEWMLNQFQYYKKRYKHESEYQVWQEGGDFNEKKRGYSFWPCKWL